MWNLGRELSLGETYTTYTWAKEIICLDSLIPGGIRRCWSHLTISYFIPFVIYRSSYDWRAQTSNLLTSMGNNNIDLKLCDRRGWRLHGVRHLRRSQPLPDGGGWRSSGLGRQEHPQRVRPGLLPGRQEPVRRGQGILSWRQAGGKYNMHLFNSYLFTNL